MIGWVQPSCVSKGRVTTICLMKLNICRKRRFRGGKKRAKKEKEMGNDDRKHEKMEEREERGEYKRKERKKRKEKRVDV